MEKIPVVENAKALMTEAVSWSVMKWLREKKTVRKVADRANAALDERNAAVKNCWPIDVRAVYEALAKNGSGTKKPQTSAGLNSLAMSTQVMLSARKVRQADEEARRARADAEETFDTAEKQLSTALAREGCRKAIRSWELHEQAIRGAEDLIPRS